MNTKNLTLKQRKFIRIYLESGNISQSALKAGYKHREQGFETLSNLINKGIFEQLLDEQGISDGYLIQVLKGGLGAVKPISCDVFIKQNGKVISKDEFVAGYIEREDWAVRHRYLETAIELKKLISKVKLKEEEEEERGLSIAEFIQKFAPDKKDEIHITRTIEDSPHLQRFLAK